MNEQPPEGFTIFERQILDYLYAKNNIDIQDIDAKINFLNMRNIDGPSGFHYYGMGYDDEATQKKCELAGREYFYLYQAGLLDE